MKKISNAEGAFMPKNSEDLYRQVINEVKDYAIFMMDLEGKITTWNEGCVNIKQYKSNEIIGSFYGILFREEDQKKGRPQMQLEYAAKEGRYEEFYWRRKKDGSLFWANTVLTAIHDENNNVIGFTKITGDLSEKKKREDELFRKTEQLMKTNADLENFVLTASHDLKGPIANIEGLLHNLEGDITEEEFIQVKEMLRLSVNKFQTILSELSKIAEEQHSIEEKTEEPVSFSEVFEDVRYSIVQEMSDACTDMEVDFKIPTILFSKVSLRSILHNLLTNAVKYRNPEKSCKIEVKTIKDNNNGVLLTVKDNGLGMKPGYEEKLFKKFKRLNENSKGIEGTGVGLYLVKRIVDNSGGKIEVESKEKEGTEFRVFLKETIN